MLRSQLSRSVLNLTLAAIFFTALWLTGCTPTPQPAPTIEVTRIVAGTPEVVIITATPEPATATPLPRGFVQINGAGATFPLPVYTEWIFAYQYVDPSVTLNYQGIGSGGGKKAIIENTVDFAGSDSLLKDEEYSAGGDLQMYPVLAGAVVPIYNITGVTATITLDRQTLVDIYSAKIKRWNDPALVALNPDVALPDAPITAVHRSDGSGTTEIFTKALSAFSTTWRDTVGGASAVEWPVDAAGNGIGGKGNAGVAAAVMSTPNSIGYVELAYAIANKIMYAKMVNKASKVVAANAESLQAAMNDFAGKFDDKLTTNIVDGEGENSWPIAGYTYIILHSRNMSDCLKAQKLLEFWQWALTDTAAGQRAADLGYAVLSDNVRQLVLTKLQEVTCQGAPVIAPR